MRLVLAGMYNMNRPTYAYEVAKASGLEVNVVLGQFHRLETAGFASHVDEPSGAPKQDRGRARVWYELTEEGGAFAATTIESTHQLVRSQARSIGLSSLA